jgi:predicted O-methyltransferase YrrM
MSIPASDGRFLYDLIIEKNYKQGLVIGTSNGYSTLWLGLAFERTGGKVITIESESNRAVEAVKNFRIADLTDVIDFRINDVFNEIFQIHGNFDFVFINAWDEDPSELLNYLNSRIKFGGMITTYHTAGQNLSMIDFIETIEKDTTLHTNINKSSGEGIFICMKK